MKLIICLDKGNTYHFGLTTGKIYELKSENSDSIEIINDFGNLSIYPKYRFVEATMIEIRDFKINQIIE